MITITVALIDNDLLSCQEDIDEKLCELEVKYGGYWKYSYFQDKKAFIGKLNLKDFLSLNGLSLVL